MTSATYAVFVRAGHFLQLVFLHPLNKYIRVNLRWLKKSKFSILKRLRLKFHGVYSLIVGHKLKRKKKVIILQYNSQLKIHNDPPPYSSSNNNHGIDAV